MTGSWVKTRLLGFAFAAANTAHDLGSRRGAFPSRDSTPSVRRPVTLYSAGSHKSPSNSSAGIVRGFFVLHQSGR
jgi:hypothetical protein